MKHHILSKTLLLLCGVTLLNNTQAQIATSQAPALSEFSPPSLQGYTLAEGKKALAISSNGIVGMSSKQSSNEEAIRAALKQCQIAANAACRISYLNTEIFDSKYQQHLEASASAFKKLSTTGKDYPLYEALDWHITAPTQLRTVNEGIHFPTPMHLNGITTIDTNHLVEKIEREHPILIDARNLSEEPDVSLPSAYLLDYAGVSTGNKKNDDNSLQLMASVMPQIAPDKSQAIVVFCTSIECWLSVNAILRLQHLGYTNLFWYRGGLQAWKLAKLPTVTTVPFATIQPSS